MRSVIVALALTLTAFAGCLTAAPLHTLSSSSVTVAPAAHADDNGRWIGRTLSNDETWTCAVVYCVPPQECLPNGCPNVACAPKSCDTIALTVSAPASGAPARDLVVIAQASNFTGGVGVRLFDAAGKPVGESTIGEYQGIAILKAAPAAEYRAEIVAEWGTDSYVGQVLARESPSKDASAKHDLLPNLVTLTPRDLRIASPGEFSGAAEDTTGMHGCGESEFVEQHARRCLRFSNAVGNVGDGPLEVHLAFADSALSLAAKGQFVQRIFASDGSRRDENVGTATYHPIHAHIHYAGLAKYSLYKLDAATGERGESVGAGTKAGFCFLDSGFIDLANPRALPHYETCPQPLDATGQTPDFMGIGPGNFDFYNWYLADQYIDVSGLADGTYLLVSTANGERTLKETSFADNEASVAFRLTGDKIDVLPVK